MHKIIVLLLIYFFQLSLLGDNPSYDFSNNIKRILRENSKYIVQISVKRKEAEKSEQPPFLGTFNQYPEYFKRPKGTVSGVVIDKDGYIITSYFNVKDDGKEGSVESTKVVLQNGKEYEARLLGWHEDLDVALLKIDAKNLSFLPTQSNPATNTHEVGEIVVVLGSTPDISRPTITFGIISAIEQLDGDVLQIDSELNYGNTGGPVFDINGNFIGIASHITNIYPWGQNSGIGFVTPNYKISEILKHLKEGKTFPKPPMPFLGVMWDQESEGVIGAKILKVLDKTPAQKSGIKPGDIIIKFNDKAIQNWNSFRNAIKKSKVGEEVKITILRDGEELELRATLIERPQQYR